MIRYIRLYAVYWRLAIIQGMVYRVAFLGRLFACVLDSGTRLAVFLYLFGVVVPGFPGWSIGEMLVLLGMAETVATLYYALFWDGLTELYRAIRQGHLEITLLKPVAAPFHLAAASPSWGEFLNVIVGVGEVGVGLALLQRAPSPGDWAVAFLLGAAALVAGFSIWFMLTTVAFYTEAQRLNEAFMGLIEVARYPREMLRGALRSLFLYVVPFALVANVPAEALLGRLQLEGALTLCLAAAVLLLLSAAFWRFSLRRYTGVSS